MRIYKHTIYRNGVPHKTAIYYADIYLPDGRRRRVSLYKSKPRSHRVAENIDTLAEEVAANVGFSKETVHWINGLEKDMLKKLFRMGLISPQRAEGGRDVERHIADFRASLEAAKCSRAHLAGLIPRIEKIVDSCRFRAIQDIDAGKIERFLAGLRDKGECVVLKKIDRETGRPKEITRRISPVTYNYYVRAIRQFCSWLVDRGRLYESPVKKTLKKVKTTGDDQRRFARVLTVDELRKLIRATMAASDWRGVSGKERAIIYLIASESGLRANEIRSLRASDFDFDGCVIRVRDSISKNKTAALLPMKQTTAAMIQEHIAGKDPNDIALNVPPETFRMIKADLKRSGIPYETEDGTAHFHSFRHGFATRLDAVVLRGSKTAVDLLRHGDARLTLNRYTHGVEERERQAINALPDLMAERPRAAGETA